MNQSVLRKKPSTQFLVSPLNSKRNFSKYLRTTLKCFIDTDTTIWTYYFYITSPLCHQTTQVWISPITLKQFSNPSPRNIWPIFVPPLCYHTCWFIGNDLLYICNYQTNILMASTLKSQKSHLFIVKLQQTFVQTEDLNEVWVFLLAKILPTFVELVSWTHQGSEWPIQKLDSNLPNSLKNQVIKRTPNNSQKYIYRTP